MPLDLLKITAVNKLALVLTVLVPGAFSCIRFLEGNGGLRLQPILRTSTRRPGWLNPF